MTDETIYAVVDIETTGTNTEKDKIIQFACVLVQNRKVINYFSTDINPLKTIPKNIEILTGISNGQVANAPYFEDLSSIIMELLSDCVFVAHNVYFDFSFLNSEFIRSGESALNTRCIDTVELAQVLFPKSPGFRVADLSEYLGLSHENPHQALSDAYATAEILIALMNKIDEIPFETLKKVTELSNHLGVDNELLFKKSLDNKKQKQTFDLLTNQKTIDMVTLKEKDYHFREIVEDSLVSYPASREEKEALKNHLYTYREEQSKMMDVIYDFINEPHHKKNLVVEASTGSGKSLGYLLPLGYSLKRNKPLVISTSTIVLQEQLMEESLPEFYQVTGQELKGLILKSSRHYIDLEKFYKTLLVEPSQQKQYIINQMAVLNWLMETETGDLDEINLNQQHPFFDQIKHHGLHTLKKDSLFYEEDFLRLVEEKKEKADVIIVNHAFLCEESNREYPLIPKANVLVIDEAHRLIPTMEEQGLLSVSLKQFYGLLRKVKESDELLLAIDDLNNQKLKNIVELLTTFSLDAKEDMQWLEKFFIENGPLSDKQRECSFEAFQDRSNWPLSMKKNLKELLTILREMNQLVTEFMSEVLDNINEINLTYYFLMTDYLRVLERFSLISTQFTEFFREMAQPSTKWLSLYNNHVILKQMNFEKISIQETTWYSQFEKIIFTSGTLQLDIASTYFEEQLQLPEAEKLLLKEAFAYENRAELIVVSDGHSFYGSETQAYIKFISQTIIETYRINPKGMLVLFTSHQILKQVYQQLNHELKSVEVELFAQGITGSKEKIAKRFSKGNGGIILGANSFWEGVDFKLPNLEVIMMTKLPFDPPKRPIVEAKYQYLENLGKNPFYDEAIPQAGSRLRQGLGRLLRNETDQGVIIMLDHRLTQASYSQKLLNYLPKDLPVKELTLANSLSEIANFFTEKDVKNCYNETNETRED